MSNVVNPALALGARIVRAGGLRACAAVVLASTIGACDPGVSAPAVPLTAAELEQFESPETLSSWDEKGSWPQFAHDPLHTGRTKVDLGTNELELAWKFRSSDYTYAYEPTYIAWSSPVVGTVGGKPMVFVGSYDHTLYAIDARTGEQAWHFTAGYPVFAAPALGRVGDRPVVFIAPRDRAVYALDARTGEKIWSIEVQKWTFTAEQSEMSAPTVIDADGKTLVYVGIMSVDRSAAQNLQRGEIFCLDGASGDIVWKQHVGHSPVMAPAVARIGGKLVVVVAAEQGAVFSYDAMTGEKLWKKPFILDDMTSSSTSMGAPNGIPLVYIGTQFNAVYALDARTGAKRWRKQTLNWVHSTPALMGTSDDLRVVVGSYDFNVHSFAADTGEVVWAHGLGGWAHTSAITARVRGKPVVVAGAWDDTLYMLSGDDGPFDNEAGDRVLWSYQTGPLQWSHVQQGDAVWASPAIALFDGIPHVVYPAYDGVVYAFRGKASGDAEASSLTVGTIQSVPPIAGTIRKE